MSHENLVRALEGNERVYYHPSKEMVAVWYGDAAIDIFNTETWEQIDRKSVTIGYKESATLAEIEDAVAVSVAADGFERRGRSQIDSKVVRR